MRVQDRLFGEPLATRRMALISTIGGGITMLLAIGLAIVAFDRPGIWIPPLFITQFPLWTGIRSLQDQRGRKRKR